MKAWKLIEKSEHWCRTYYFKDKYGTMCNMDRAYSYCLVGALQKCYGPGSIYNKQYERVQDSIGGSITRWNDDLSTNHGDVLNLLKTLDI